MRYFLCLTLLFIANINLAFADDFPLREHPDFKNLKTVSTAELYKWKESDNVIVVDVRSQEEFDVIHINDAKFIPISKKNFLALLEKERPKDGDKKIATYCNGITCAKSYKAAKMATESGFKEVYVYDAGVPNWVQVYPEKTTLLSQSPADKNKIISKDQFKSKLIEYDKFKNMAKDKNSLIVDIRDPMQRRVKLTEVSSVKNLPFNRLIPMLDKGLFKDKQLLIFDAVGKQIKWLQYHLESEGYKNYFFLKGGVREATGKDIHY